jgi:D-serine dehydratase
MENATITTLTAQFPLVEDLIALKETTWLNPRTTTLAEGLPYVGLTKADVDDARAPQPLRAVSGESLPGNGRNGRDY